MIKGIKIMIEKETRNLVDKHALIFLNRIIGIAQMIPKAYNTVIILDLSISPFVNIV